MGDAMSKEEAGGTADDVLVRPLAKLWWRSVTLIKCVFYSILITCVLDSLAFSERAILRRPRFAQRYLNTPSPLGSGPGSAEPATVPASRFALATDCCLEEGASMAKALATFVVALALLASSTASAQYVFNQDRSRVLGGTGANGYQSIETLYFPRTPFGPFSLDIGNAPLFYVDSLMGSFLDLVDAQWFGDWGMADMAIDGIGNSITLAQDATVNSKSLTIG